MFVFLFSNIIIEWWDNLVIRPLHACYLNPQ